MNEMQQLILKLKRELEYKNLLHDCEVEFYFNTKTLGICVKHNKIATTMYLSWSEIFATKPEDIVYRTLVQICDIISAK